MNTIAAFARDSLFLCARASVKTLEFYVLRHGHVPRPSLPHVIDIWHHSVPLLIIGFRVVHFFEHLAVSHDGFAQLLHVRPQSAIHLRASFQLAVSPPGSVDSAPSGQLPQRPARPDVPEPSPDHGSGH